MHLFDLFEYNIKLENRQNQQTYYFILTFKIIDVRQDPN